VARVETPVTAARGFEVSARRFRQVAFVAAGMLLLVVATGATVRLTASGLGCESWPGCEDRYRLPEQSFHSYVEFGNRVIAFLTILATFVAGVASVFVATLPRWAKALAWLTFVGTLAQAPLGAITIHYHLNPWLVLSHFLLSVVVLGLGIGLAVEVSRRVPERLPDWVRAGGLLVWLAAGVLIVSGTLATASGPHPGSSGKTIVHRVWAFEPAVYWHVRATAVFGLSFAALLVWLYRKRSAHLRWALIVLGLLALQMTIGEVQYRTGLRWWLVLGHVTVAATVWAAFTAFVVRLWRSGQPSRMSR
jgi:cytochrome c oxidase assembly protein subunit 15